MTTRLGVVMDPIADITPYKDTTLALLLEAMRREYEIIYFEMSDLFVRDGVGYGTGRRLEVFDDNVDWYRFTGESEILPLAELDMSGAAPTELVLAGPEKVIVTEGEKLDIAVSGEDAAVDAVRFSLDEGSLGISRAKDMGKIGGVATVRVTMPSLMP